MNTMSVVIPNWNGMEHLPECLDSLRAQVRPPEEVIVVDNGSTDGSVAYLEERHPWIRLVRFPENLGFARAANAGIAASEGSLVALLNNDTELDPAWTSSLAAALEATPAAGLAASRMLDYHDRGRIDAAGDILTRGFSPTSRGMGEPDDGRYRSPGVIFGACAGAAMYRREVFSRVGVFDEEFISYYEDADLSFRAALAGFACLYVPDAVCYHKRGGTARRLRDYPVRMQERNLTALQVKNLPWQVLVTSGVVVAAGRLRRLVRLTLAGAGRAAWTGFAQGLLLLPSMLRKRRVVQRLRTIPTAAVRALAGRPGA